MLLVDGTHSVVVLHDFSSHPTSSDTALDSDDIESSSSSSSKRISSTTRGFAGTSDDEMVFVIEPVSEETLAIEGEDNEVGEGDNDNSEDGVKEEEEEGEWEKDVTSDDDEDDGIPSSTT